MITYSENYVTRKASTEVNGLEEKKYRIDYIVRNPSDQPVNTVVATAYRVETDPETSTETQTRVANACVDVDNNRNYFAVEQHADVPMDDQATLMAQYMADVKVILSE